MSRTRKTFWFLTKERYGHWNGELGSRYRISKRKYKRLEKKVTRAEGKTEIKEQDPALVCYDEFCNPQCATHAYVWEEFDIPTDAVQYSTETPTSA